jgi:hypothetical protein
LHAQRERDAVGGPGVDLLRVAVLAHDEFGEERRVLDVVNDDLFERGMQCLEHRAHEIVRERTRYGGSFERQGDRGGFERTDQDRQEPFAFEVFEDDDGVVGQQVDAELVDLHLAHASKSYASRTIPCPERTRPVARYGSLMRNRRLAQRREIDHLQRAHALGASARRELSVRDDRSQRR